MNMKCTDAYRRTQVTISVPREAGDTLKYLAKFNTQLLESLGILAIRVDGCETVSLCSKPREQISKAYPQIMPTSSDALCVNSVKGSTVPVRNRYRKQVSESNVGSSKQSCDIPSVPFEGRSDKILAYPHMPNVRLGSCQNPKSRQRMMEPPSSSVFQSRYFNEHCSVNSISRDPCPSFAPAAALGRSHFYFEHPTPGWNLTEKPNDMNSSALKSAGLFHVLSSSNNVPTTSSLQSTSSIGSQVLENARMKVPKVRQRRKTKQSSSLRNRCIDVESPFHQITSASFSKHPPVPEETLDYFDGNNILPNFVRPPCKRHFSPSTNVSKTTNLTENLSESDLVAKKFVSRFANQQLRLDGSVATELASVSPSSLTAINSEVNNASVVAFPSNLKSSADCLVSDNGDLSEVKSSSGGFKETTENVIESGFLTSEIVQQTAALKSSTSFHLDERSGLLITLSPRMQSSSFGIGDGVGAMPNYESMGLKHVLEGTNDETCVRQSENVGKVDDVELCNNIDQLPLETFTEEQVHLLDENHQENCLDFQCDSSENPDISEVDADVLKSNKEFCNEITVSAKESLTMLDSDDPSITEVKRLSMDSNDEFTLTDVIGLSSLQQPDNTSGKCVDINTYKKFGIENVSKESYNLEMEISVVVADDICESNEDKSVGNISPDSAVVGDVASVETVEENEMLSVPLLSDSLPLDRHTKPFFNDSAISSTDVVIMNQVGNIRDQSYNSVTDIRKISSSSDANDCVSVVGMIETDELNAVKCAHVNDSTNNINLDNDVPGPIELTWSKLTKEDIEVIKLNNKHSALDLAVTHFEGVSRCPKSMLSEDLRRLDALVLCEFDSVVVNPSSLFCVAKVADKANSKVPRIGNKCMTRKLSEPLKINRRPFSLCSLLAKRRMKRRIIGNIPALNREYGHLHRCLLNASRPLSVTKKFT